jgi:acyl carrier protein
MEDRIKSVMSQIFGITPHSIDAASSQETITRWDSLGHMNLCAALEEEFNVQFDTDQVVSMVNFHAVLKTISALTSSRG